MKKISKSQENILKSFGHALVNNKNCFKLISPMKKKEGFWFGGGNLFPEKCGKNFLLIGRYRDYGDSREGISKGKRGWKVSIFRGKLKDFQEGKVNLNELISVKKMENVLSYEGSSIYEENEKLYCLISCEKIEKYPDICKDFQKKGTGIWSIDKFEINLSEKKLQNRETFIKSNPHDISCLHLKDPCTSLFDDKILCMFCCCSFNWTSSVSGFCKIKNSKITKLTNSFFKKGLTWDCAMGRISGRVKVPKLGEFKEMPDMSLYFYDSCECVNKHKNNINVIGLPRGYSCEEISSIAWGFDSDFPKLNRLSTLKPMFYSKDDKNNIIGNGTLRYSNCSMDMEGNYYVVFQKSVEDKSQPLFGNYLSKKSVIEIFNV